MNGGAAAYDGRMRLRSFVVFALAIALAACGETTPSSPEPDASADAPDETGFDGGAGDAPLDRGSDAIEDAARDASRHACGASSCAVDEVCVHPCCGGAAPPCMPLSDGGGCEPGFHWVAACSWPSSGGPACQGDPCTPPAPSCVKVPASCGATPACPCLSGDVCSGSGSCGYVDGLDVACVCA